LNPTATDKPATKDDAPGTDVRRRLYGTPDFSLKVTEAISDGTSDVFQLMRGRVPGLTGTGNNLQLRGISSFVSNSEPLYLLDGVPTDKGTLMGTPPKAVEYIDVLKGASASSMGSRGAGGVINILTKRGYANSSSEESNSRVRGYSLVREFYAPNYTAAKPTNAVPDYRSTIHWVPMLQTDANGKASISFWNSDESNAKFRIVVEGATAKGQLGVSKTIYQIQ
jgi:outer membrane receptor protein involved in Fe transport